MRVGVPAEIKDDEHRVALTPAGVSELVVAGHEVLIQQGAGLGSAFPDEDYERSGARVVGLDEVWERGQLILKVKEPIGDECDRLGRQHVLFTYLHLAASRKLTEALLESDAVCIAYETVDVGGRLPLLAPMSEIAGRLAPQVGAWALEKPQGGRGVLLGGVPGVPGGRVVVIGGGMVGTSAALVAIGMRADVWILERSLDRMRQLEYLLDGRARMIMSSPLTIEHAVAEADLIIGAALVPGAKAPQLLTRAGLAELRRGAVLVDVAIDQGGCFETSRPTTHSDPIYEVDGVVHYCVANMPGSVPASSTQALVNATLPYARTLADQGLEGALAGTPELASGVNVLHGRLTHDAVAEAHGLEYTPLELALAA